MLDARALAAGPGGGLLPPELHGVRECSGDYDCWACAEAECGAADGCEWLGDYCAEACGAGKCHVCGEDECEAGAATSRRLRPLRRRDDDFRPKLCVEAARRRTATFASRTTATPRTAACATRACASRPDCSRPLLGLRDGEACAAAGCAVVEDADGADLCVDPRCDDCESCGEGACRASETCELYEGDPALLGAPRARARPDACVPYYACGNCDEDLCAVGYVPGCKLSEDATRCEADDAALACSNASTARVRRAGAACDALLLCSTTPFGTCAQDLSFLEDGMGPCRAELCELCPVPQLCDAAPGACRARATSAPPTSRPGSSRPLLADACYACDVAACAATPGCAYDDQTGACGFDCGADGGGVVFESDAALLRARAQPGAWQDRALAVFDGAAALVAAGEKRTSAHVRDDLCLGDGCYRVDRAGFRDTFSLPASPAWSGDVALGCEAPFAAASPAPSAALPEPSARFERVRDALAGSSETTALLDGDVDAPEALEVAPLNAGYPGAMLPRALFGGGGEAALANAALGLELDAAAPRAGAVGPPHRLLFLTPMAALTVLRATLAGGDVGDDEGGGCVYVSAAATATAAASTEPRADGAPEIADCGAGDRGGGVFLAAGDVLVVDDGAVRNCDAPYGGGVAGERDASASRCRFVAVLDVSTAAVGCGLADSTLCDAVDLVESDRWALLGDADDVDGGGTASAFDATSEGWRGARLRLAFPMDDADDLVLDVPSGSHANARTFRLREDGAPGLPLFEANAAVDGGALHLADASSAFLGVKFADNQGGAGGAVHAGRLAAFVANNSLLQGNAAAEGGALYGGAMSSLSLTTSLASGNAAPLPARSRARGGPRRRVAAILKSNTVDGDVATPLAAGGGAVALFDANVAHGGGGALAALGGSAPATVSGDCRDAAVFADWRRTTETCLPTAFLGITGVTCDAWAVEGTKACEGGDKVFDCAGCACSFALDDEESKARYFRDHAGRRGARPRRPAAAALRRFDFCLPPGKVQVRAFDDFGQSWFGGSFSVRVKGGEMVAGPPVAEFSSAPLTIAVGLDRATQFVANEATAGGGGALYADAASTVVATDGSTVVVAGGANLTGFSGGKATRTGTLARRARCPRDADCAFDGGGNGTAPPGADLRPRRGYWRSTPFSSNVAKCKFEFHCKGGVDLWAKTRPRRPGDRAGALCAFCEAGFVHDRFDGSCVDCRGAKKRSLRVAVVFVGLGLFFGRSSRDFYGDLWPQAKQLIAFWQICGSLQRTFDVLRFPRLFRAFALAVSAVSLNFYAALPGLCREADHVDELVGTTLWPLAASGAILVAHAAKTRRAAAARARARLSMGLFLLLAYVVVASCAAVAFATFDCDDHFARSDGEPRSSPYLDASFLRIDYRVDCASKRYARARAYAGLMIAVYPVGVPLLCFVLLWRKRDDVDPPGGAKRRFARAPRPTAATTTTTGGPRANPGDGLRVPAPARNDGCNHLAFLFAEYAPARWWFEPVDMLRRIVMTCLLPAIGDGDTVRAAAACARAALALGFAWVYAVADPHVRAATKRFALAMHGALVVVLLLVLVLFNEQF
ncbi:hypothetical protein SO694_00008254 [Aureococcus anophagefferens]|uniref:TNFR-Cys domain-containing protein n=1 Tax=Aureococcus anophagefferens TaxID=44056 RepID=A0ABR1GDN7_AURAN